MQNDTADLQLATFAAQLTLEDIPHAIRHEARRAIMNNIATMMAGAGEPVIGLLLDEYGPHAAQGEAVLAGRRQRVDPRLAAFLNAAAANVHDFDDTHMPTILHPSSPVLAPLAARAATTPMSGADLIRSFVAGVEVECRIGLAISPSHYARGWHITSTCGQFGSAAACGRHAGLSAERMLAAFSCAAVQASGMVEALGTMAKSISVGNAARGGMAAVGLAQAGLDGPPRPLTGERGFLNLYAETPDTHAMTAALGTNWALAQTAYKPYPVGVVLNPVIDAVLELLVRVAGARVEAVTLHGHPLLRERTDRPDVVSGRLSQVSAQHAIAISLLRGRPGLAEFEDAAVAATLGGRPRIDFIDDAGRDLSSVRAEFHLRGEGSTLIEIPAARGALSNPLTDSDIEAKLRLCAERAGMAARADAIIDAAWSLEHLPDARALIDLWRLP